MAEQTTQEIEEQKTFTQEEVNKLVGSARIKEREKYAHFDEYKNAYEELEKRKTEEMSELEKERSRSKAFEDELTKLKFEKQQIEWKEEVAKETGVPIEVVHGATKEEMEKNASAVSKYFGKSTKPFVGSDGFAPSEKKGKTTREQFAETLNDIF